MNRNHSLKLNDINKDLVITFDLLERLKSPRGGYSRASLQAMGISWPPKRGWRKKLIDRAKAHEAQRQAGLNPPKNQTALIPCLDCGRNKTDDGCPNCLQDQMAALAVTLRKLHNKCQERCDVFFEQDGKPTDFSYNLGEAYVESSLCDEVTDALSKRKTRYLCLEKLEEKDLKDKVEYLIFHRGGTEVAHWFRDGQTFDVDWGVILLKDVTLICELPTTPPTPPLT